MTYKLSDLLPYTKETLLSSLQEKIRVLQLLNFLYVSAQDAAQAFRAKQYSAFDAQVSENLCQIRAYQLVYMLDKHADECTGFADDFFYAIKKDHEKCTALISEYDVLSKQRPSHYTKLIHQTMTLEEMLQNHELDIELSELSYLLVQKYILSKYKLVGEHRISRGMDYDKICLGLNISSKTFARKFVHRLQRNVSNNSCQFIFKLCYELNLDQYHLFLLKSLYFQDEVGRHVLACYEITKILIKHAFQTNKYIKVMVTRIFDSGQDNITFYLKPSYACGHYVLSKTEKKTAEDCMTTFSGIAYCNKNDIQSHEDYIAYFLQIGFENVILANMAQHSQYAGILLDDKKFNPYLTLDLTGLQQTYLSFIKKSEKQFLQHKYLSSKIGCAQENTALFLLTHVRCDDISLQLINNTKSNKLVWLEKYRDLHHVNHNLDRGALAYER